MKDRRSVVSVVHKIVIDTCRLYSGGHHEFTAILSLNHNSVRYEIYNCLEHKTYYYDNSDIAFDYWNNLFG